jgi:2-hydroxychromene-2-carboxylate isomerase
MTKTIDYFFGIGSPWTFIGLEPFAALALRPRQ